MIHDDMPSIMSENEDFTPTPQFDLNGGLSGLIVFVPSRFSKFSAAQLEAGRPFHYKNSFKIDDSPI